MKRRVLAAVFVAMALVVGWPAGASAAGGPGLLTVAGVIAHPNRSAADSFRDAFFGYHDIAFDRARTFDHADLATLPQVTVTARAEGWPAPQPRRPRTGMAAL